MKEGSKVQMRGGRLYASIYCALPGTCREVAEKLSLLVEPVENCIRDMKALGLIHRSKVVGSGDRQVPTGYYERGEGVNVPYPRAGLTHRRPRAGSIAFMSVLDAFESGATIQECTDETGCAKTYIRTVIKVFKEAGMAHVSDWKTETKYQRAPVWKLIPGESVRRPKPIPRAVTNQRYWAKRRANLAAERVRLSFAIPVGVQPLSQGSAGQ